MISVELRLIRHVYQECCKVGYGSVLVKVFQAVSDPIKIRSHKDQLAVSSAVWFDQTILPDLSICLLTVQQQTILRVAIVHPYLMSIENSLWTNKRLPTNLNPICLLSATAGIFDREGKPLALNDQSNSEWGFGIRVDRNKELPEILPNARLAVVDMVTFRLQQQLILAEGVKDRVLAMSRLDFLRRYSD